MIRKSKRPAARAKQSRARQKPNRAKPRSKKNARVPNAGKTRKNAAKAKAEKVSPRSVLEGIMGNADTPGYVKAQVARTLLKHDRLSQPKPPPPSRDDDAESALLVRTYVLLQRISVVGDDDEPVAKNGTYRGVELEAGLSPESVAVVQKEIDFVFTLDDPVALFEWASSLLRSPESRLLAHARCAALDEKADREKKTFPIRANLLKASTSGLNSKKWRDPSAPRSKPCCLGTSLRTGVVHRKVRIQQDRRAEMDYTVSAFLSGIGAGAFYSPR
jgi:hypothetical protein